MKPISYVVRNFHYILPWKWRSGFKAIYRRFTKNGVFLTKEELPSCSLLPSMKLDLALELVAPASVLDAGCGVGKATEYFAKRGVDVLGLEASRVALQYSVCPDKIRKADLRKRFDLGRKFDMVWCFEVAEHIHPRYVRVFLDNLTRHSDRIVMSAAPPGQGGEAHFNEQPESYWVHKMHERGYALNPEWTVKFKAVREFYSQNMMVFTRTDNAQLPKANAASLEEGSIVV